MMMRVQSPGGVPYEVAVPMGVAQGGSFLVDVPVDAPSRVPPAAAPAPGGMTTMTVTVPAGCGPGSEIQIQTPSGALMCCIVPAGVVAGGLFNVNVPDGPPASPGAGAAGGGVAAPPGGFDPSFLASCTDVRIVLAVMCDHRLNATAQGHACAALARLVEGENDANRVPAFAGGATALLIATMEVHRADPGVTAAALKAVRFLSQGHKPIIDDLVAKGVLPLTLAAMRGHKLSSGVQAWGCTVLMGLAWDASVRDSIGAAGGLSAIVRCSITTHLKDATVVYQGCKALANLLVSNETNRQLLKEHEAVIVAAKAEHDFNQQVREAADTLLRVLQR
jgi:hypothetical protein